MDLVRLLAARERGAPASTEMCLTLNFRMPFPDGRLRMRVAVTLCDQTEHQRRGNEDSYSLFGRSETESLPHLLKFETPAVFQFTKVLRINSQFDARAAAEPEPNGSAV